MAESSKEKKAASSPIPPAKMSRSVHANSDRNNASSNPMDDAEETKDLLKQVCVHLLQLGKHRNDA